MGVASLVEEFAAANPRSAEAHRRARGLFPSGVTHDVRHAEPFPLLVTKAHGSRKRDADGHLLVDYVMGHGSLLLGHGHPEVVEAVRHQAGLGMHLGASTEEEADWAEAVVSLVPSAERVRFTSSGTEATLLALRVARGCTGRDRVVKLAGHFHGWHDSATPGNTLPVRPGPPVGTPFDPNVAVVAPDVAAVEAELAAGGVAAVLLEPSGASWGAVPLPDGFLAAVRAACDRAGALVVFDEVVTGFRWAPGGVQELTGVLPDLTALAKVLAGGLPGGALVGRAEVMAALDVGSPRKVDHPGTHNGHPLAAVAGTTTLRLLADGALGAKAAATAAELRTALNAVLARRGAPGFAYGQSSTFSLVLGTEAPNFSGGGDLATPAVDPVVLKAGVPEPLLPALQAAMALGGVHLFRGRGLVSSAHTADDVALTVAAFETAVARLQAEGLLA